MENPTACSGIRITITSALLLSGGLGSAYGKCWPTGDIPWFQGHDGDYCCTGAPIQKNNGWKCPPPAAPAQAPAQIAPINPGAPLGPQSGMAVVNPGSGLVGNSGAGLVGVAGAGLIGNSGSTLIGNAGAGLIGNGGTALTGGGRSISSLQGKPPLVLTSLVIDKESGAGTLTLSAVADSPIRVTFRSSSGCLLVPPAVTVPKGSSSASFAVRRSGFQVEQDSTVSITAAAQGDAQGSQSASFICHPPTPTLSLTLNSVTGAGSVSVRHRGRSAPAGVSLSSNNQCAAVPASASIDAAGSAAFTAKMTVIDGCGTATITASFPGALPQTAEVDCRTTKKRGCGRGGGTGG